MWVPIKYYVNEKKRTVVAVMDIAGYVSNDSQYFARKVLTSLRKQNPLFQKNCNYRNFTDIVSVFFAMERGILLGKAKCSPDDEWNEQIGKEIARNRLLVKWNNWLAQVMYKAGDFISELAIQLEDMADFCSEKAESIAESIVEIL